MRMGSGGEGGKVWTARGGKLPRTYPGRDISSLAHVREKYSAKKNDTKNDINLVKKINFTLRSEL